MVKQTSSDNNNNKPKRNPFCSRCRNHGKSAQVKGHKRHCEYRDCQCEGCRLVEARQLVSAAQIKRRRDQKQDEECGRRIEVSPPVLTRKPSRAADLITNGLLRQLPHLQQQQHLDHLNHHHHLQHHHQLLHQQVPPQPPQPTAPIHEQQQQHLNNGSPILSSASQQQLGSPQASSSSTSASVALSNALHLFHFPSSASSLPTTQQQQQQQQQVPPQPAPPLPSAAATAAALANQANQVAAAAAAAAAVPLWARPPPNACDQMQLVMDIYNSYGPLAIYSWLRAEHFNLPKVRYMIELSRAPYNDLMDLKYKSSSNDTNQLINNSSDHHRHMTINLTRNSCRSILSTHHN